MSAITREESNRRLLVLAEFLETKVPTKRFDYNQWADDAANLVEPLCGATACALGWATAIPEFELELRPDSHGNPYVEFKATQSLDDDGFSGFYRSLGVAAQTFGLTADEAKYLFVPAPDEYDDDLGEYVAVEDDATPAEVAEKILRFVEARS